MKTIRSIDRSRPVTAFSANGNTSAFGTGYIPTDICDIHDYTGVTQGGAWSSWHRNIPNILKRAFAGCRRDTLPVIATETIGGGWGWISDPDFKLGDIEKYEKYALKTPTNWDHPNGIGYAGSIGLKDALSGNGKKILASVIAKRMFEMYRTSDLERGFFSAYGMDMPEAADIWTQPVLVTMFYSSGLPLRNLWNGYANPSVLQINNQSENITPAGRVMIECVSGNKRAKVAEFTVPSIGVGDSFRKEMFLNIPEDFRGHFILNVSVSAGGKRISRNEYPVFAASRAILDEKLKTWKKVLVANTGSLEDAAEFADFLAKRGLKAEIVSARGPFPGDAKVLVIPPAVKNKKRLQWNRLGVLEVARKGGTVVILEQTPENGEILPGVMLGSATNWSMKQKEIYPFADLIFPNHPVFSELDQRNFDSWKNVYGAVSDYVIMPFTKNAIAAVPPLVGNTITGVAVWEAAYGSGRIFWNQLAAQKCWGEDSAATQYLLNILKYAVGDAKFSPVKPLVLNGATETFPLAVNAEFKNIDLRPYMNSATFDEVADDRKGGWTDQGSNDFRGIGSGHYKAAGIPLEIVDAAKNGGRNAIALRGDFSRHYPETVKGIRVDGKFSRLYFHHAGAFVRGNVIGCYRIHYKDGTYSDFEAVNGETIGDWWSGGFISRAKVALHTSNPTKEYVCSYIACWENPHPEKEISHIDIYSAESAAKLKQDWNPGYNSTLLVLSITGEVFKGLRVTIDTPDSPAKWNDSFPGVALTNGLKSASNRASRKLISRPLPDGGKGTVSQLSFPKPEKDAVPTLYASFKVPGTFSEIKPTVLRCSVLAEEPGEIIVMIPARNWECSYWFRLKYTGGSTWKEYVIPVLPENRRAFEDKTLRGEIWFRNVKPSATSTFAITNITLE